MSSFQLKAGIILLTMFIITAESFAQQHGQRDATRTSADLRSAGSYCQMHEYEASKELAFENTVDALSESGFVVRSTDFENGHISAEKERDYQLARTVVDSDGRITVSVIVTSGTTNLTSIQVHFGYVIRRSPALNIVSDADLLGARLCNGLFESLDEKLLALSQGSNR